MMAALGSPLATEDRTTTRLRIPAHRIGAVLYVLWGILHVVIGIQVFRLNLGESTHAAVAMTGSALEPTVTPKQLGPVVFGIINQRAWNLVWFGGFAIAVAWGNWRNNLAAYWANLAVVSLGDIGFIGAILLPGYIDPMMAFTGPLLWVLAVLFSTIGILQPKCQRS